MPAWKRIVIGSIGALMPVLLMIVKIDVVFIINNEQITSAHLLGFAIKYICLAVIGATIAYLNDGVTKPLTIFQIDLAVPALIASLITTNGIASIQKEIDVTPDRYRKMEYQGPLEKTEFKAFESNGEASKPPPEEPESVGEQIKDAIEPLTGQIYEKTVTEPNVAPSQDFDVMDLVTGDGYRDVVPPEESE